VSKALTAAQRPPNITAGVYMISNQETNKTLQVEREKQAFIREALCQHAIFDNKGNVCCIENLEAPTECSPKNCKFLRGIFP